MKVVLVTPNLFPPLGGLETAVWEIARNLSHLGVEIVVIAGKKGSDTVTYRRYGKVKVTYIPVRAPKNTYWIPKDSSSFMKLLDSELNEAICHAHNVHAVMPIMTYKLKLRGKKFKLVFTPHYHGSGHSITRSVIWKLFWRKRVAECLSYTDIIHSVSEVEKKKLVKDFTLKDKIKLVPQGIARDVLEFSWNGRHSNYILYAGRLEKYKHLDTMIMALSLARETLPQLRLKILGSGHDEERLRNLCEKKFGKRYDAVVSFEGVKPRKEYLRSLSEARAAISLSQFEAFNIFLAEAYAMNVPIIASVESVPFCPSLGFRFNHIKDIAKLMVAEPKSRKVNCIMNTWDKVCKTLLEAVYL